MFVAAVFVGIAIYLLALGFRDVDLSVVAPFRYSYLLTSALGGFLVFREVPDGWTVVGAALIVGSGIYALHREAVRRRSLTGTASASCLTAPILAKPTGRAEARPSTKFQLTAPGPIGLATTVLCDRGGRSMRRDDEARPACGRPEGTVERAFAAGTCIASVPIAFLTDIVRDCAPRPLGGSGS